MNQIVGAYHSFPVLLTGTIIPNPNAIGKLTDPKTRQQHYIETLEWMAMSETGVDTVVFCENSSADLTAFQYLPEIYASNGKTLEIHKVPMPNSEAFYGKGWGEGIIIKWALENIPSLQQAKGFFKITGRLKVLNLKRVINIVKLGLSRNPRLKFISQTFSSTEIISDIGGPIAYTQMFWSNPEFYIDHMVNLFHQVDDDKGLYFEHVIARKLVSLKDEYEFAVLPIPLIIRGIAGNNGKPLMPNLRMLIEEIKQTIIPFTNLAPLDLDLGK